MKPFRLTLTNNLVVGYGLNKKLDMYDPRPATKDELQTFHDEDYIDFLSRCVHFPTAYSYSLLIIARASVGSHLTTCGISPRSSQDSTSETIVPFSATCSTTANNTLELR